MWDHSIQTNTPKPQKPSHGLLLLSIIVKQRNNIFERIVKTITTLHYPTTKPTFLLRDDKRYDGQ